jgi:hypothetical protein
MQQTLGLFILRSNSEGGLKRKFCNILWFTFLSNSLFLNTVSSLENTALQSEGAKPLQFVSWWNIFM